MFPFSAIVCEKSPHCQEPPAQKCSSMFVCFCYIPPTIDECFLSVRALVCKKSPHFQGPPVPKRSSMFVCCFFYYSTDNECLLSVRSRPRTAKSLLPKISSMTPSFLNMLFLTFVFSILPTSRCSECLNTEHYCVYKHKAYFTVSLSSLTSFLYHDHCPHLHYHRICAISTNYSHLIYKIII